MTFEEWWKSAQLPGDHKLPASQGWTTSRKNLPKCLDCECFNATRKKVNETDVTHWGSCSRGVDIYDGFVEEEFGCIDHTEFDKK